MFSFSSALVFISFQLVILELQKIVYLFLLNFSKQKYLNFYILVLVNYNNPSKNQQTLHYIIRLSDHVNQ